MNNQELKDLAAYLDKVADAIPKGLSQLKDAVSFATIDLNAYAYQGIRISTYSKSLEFALSIPKVEDLEGDELTHWMLHDMKFLEYLTY
jgi:hypothetical protein